MGNSQIKLSLKKKKIQYIFAHLNGDLEFQRVEQWKLVTKKDGRLFRIVNTLIRAIEHTFFK